MLHRIEAFFWNLRRRISRSDWAVRLLNLPTCEGTGHHPGLLMIQIDGLSSREMERAIRKGRMPFLKRLLGKEFYRQKRFYSGLPASTPAVQGELFYGTPCAVPAFSFFDREAGRVASLFEPEEAKRVEARLRKKAAGLLEGGSSWSNIYQGGAAEEESHFCTASLGLGQLFKTRPLLNLLTFPILHFPSVAQILFLLLVEGCIAIGDLFRGWKRGNNMWKEFKFVFARVAVCIALRELITIGARIDLVRGLPIIHVNFLGYDEQSHRRGPASAFAHWSLKGIDRCVKALYKTAHRSLRREYQVWIYSDHGQEATQPFVRRYGRTLNETVRQCLARLDLDFDVSNWELGHRPSWAFLFGGRVSRRFLEHLTFLAQDKDSEENSYWLAAMGPVAHLNFKISLRTETKRELARQLVEQGGVPIALLVNDRGKVEWHTAREICVLPEECPDWLKDRADVLDWLLGDVTALCRHEHAGDLVLLGWNPSRPLSFPEEWGAHAGPGPRETEGFLLVPDSVKLPHPSKNVLRPLELRQAALRFLGKDSSPDTPRQSTPVFSDEGANHELKESRHTKRHPTLRGSKRPVQFRVMTYNAHSGMGMDGRASIARIARGIERYHPDIVAVQEVDVGKRRSLGLDQPRELSRLLRMDFTYCPTVEFNGEQYGHALLSRLPLTPVRQAVLHSGPVQSGTEPRMACWARIQIRGFPINVVAAHLSLNAAQRRLQTLDLLGEKWIGDIPPEEPVILCGDLNMTPRSVSYRWILERLLDVQCVKRGGKPRRTFSTMHPLLRIDHIFISPHFAVKEVLAPRTSLSRVASDHLPLIATLELL